MAKVKDDVNAVCAKCTKTCKQTSLVAIHFCPQFAKKGAKVKSV